MKMSVFSIAEILPCPTSFLISATNSIFDLARKYSNSFSFSQKNAFTHILSTSNSWKYNLRVLEIA